MKKTFLLLISFSYALMGLDKPFNYGFDYRRFLITTSLQQSKNIQHFLSLCINSIPFAIGWQVDSVFFDAWCKTLNREDSQLLKIILLSLFSGSWFVMRGQRFDRGLVKWIVNNSVTHLTDSSFLPLQKVYRFGWIMLNGSGIIDDCIYESIS